MSKGGEMHEHPATCRSLWYLLRMPHRQRRRWAAAMNQCDPACVWVTISTRCLCSRSVQGRSAARSRRQCFEDGLMACMPLRLAAGF